MKKDAGEALICLQHIVHGLLWMKQQSVHRSENIAFPHACLCASANKNRTNVLFFQSFGDFNQLVRVSHSDAFASSLDQTAPLPLSKHAADGIKCRA